MKQVHLHKKPTRFESFKIFLAENIFTPHKIGFIISISLSLGLSYLIPIYFAVIPFIIHSVLWLYTYYKYTIKESWWKKYVEKYGNDKGEIPPDVRMRHKKMIKHGMEIKI